MNKTSQETSRTRWEEHVVAWRKSGLTQSAYCREHGLLRKLFSAWVCRIRKGSREQGEPLTIVPVMVKGSSVAGTLDTSISLRHHSGWELTLPAHVPAAWMGNVLRELS